MPRIAFFSMVGGTSTRASGSLRRAPPRKRLGQGLSDAQSFLKLFFFNRTVVPMTFLTLPRKMEAWNS